MKQQTLIIGIGGGGQNILNQIHEQFKDCIFISINADEQILKCSKTGSILFPQEKRIFKKFYKNSILNKLKYLCNNIFCKQPSYGCGGDKNIGESLAKQHVKLLKNELLQCNRVFVVSTFGGGFGTGATPIIADYIKQFDINLTVIVTIPFNFEGHRRRIQANEGIEKLKKLNENLIIINNDDIIGNLDKHISFQQALEVVGNLIYTKIKDILETENKI